MAAKKKVSTEGEVIDLAYPDFRVLTLEVVGNAPYVSNNFDEEALSEMREKQAMGSAAAKGQSRTKAKPPKDFQASYRGSLHHDNRGGTNYGVPATAFRAAIVRACSTEGIEMTRAKQCVFVLADGFDTSGKPIVLIHDREPVYFERYVRLANGAPDIKAAARFEPGWRCVLRLRYDAKQFTPRTIASLVMRAGIGIGVGAGRPFSTNSVGQGWGTFDIREDVPQAAE